MSQMNPGQARVVDPILTTFVRGYQQAEMVALKLFPRVGVQQYGGQVIEFGKESFRLYNTVRAPGAKTARINTGYLGKPYSVQPRAVDAGVPRELMRDASQVPNVDLASQSVTTVLDVMQLEHEYNSAQIARNAANYDASHKAALLSTARWGGAASDPSKDIETGKEAIRSTCGKYPNVAILPPSCMSALRFNAKILDRTKYTSRDSATPELLASLWGIQNVLVGQAVYAQADDTWVDVWGDDVILAYVNQNPSPSIQQPSFGYTYTIEGHPMVEQARWDADTKSWIYGVSYDNTPVLSGMLAGYLIQNAGGDPT